MEYLFLFYSIQLLPETVADLVFVLGLLFSSPRPLTSFFLHAAHDVKRQKIMYTDHGPAPLNPAHGLHRAHNDYIMHPVTGPCPISVPLRVKTGR